MPTRSKVTEREQAVMRPAFTSAGLTILPTEVGYDKVVVNDVSQINYQTGKDTKTFRACEASKLVHWSVASGGPFQYPVLDGGTVKVWKEYGDRKWSISALPSSSTSGDIQSVIVVPGRTEVLGPTQDEVDRTIHDLMIKVASAPVQTGKNYAQAILELKDIPKTVKTVKNISKLLRKPKDIIKKYPKKLRKWEDSSFATVIDGYLGYVFGIAPTWRDIKDTINRCRRDFAKPSIVHYSKGQTVRARTYLRGSSRIPSGVQKEYSQEYKYQMDVVGDFDASGTHDLKSRVPYDTSMQHGILDAPHPALPDGWNTAYSVTSYDITVFARVAMPVDFARKSPALQGMDPTSTAWELLPFSFVVDWFADLGKWLRDENKLATAKYGGFYLDASQGVWASVRKTIRTFWPSIDARSTLTPTGGKATVSGSAWTGYKINIPVRLDVTTSVHWTEVETHTSYKRYKLSDNVHVAKLNTKGLGDQGVFQWTAGTALAIQNCEALQKLLSKKR